MNDRDRVDGESDTSVQPPAKLTKHLIASRVFIMLIAAVASIYTACDSIVTDAGPHWLGVVIAAVSVCALAYLVLDDVRLLNSLVHVCDRMMNQALPKLDDISQRLPDPSAVPPADSVPHDASLALAEVSQKLSQLTSALPSNTAPKCPRENDEDCLWQDRVNELKKSIGGLDDIHRTLEEICSEDEKLRKVIRRVMAIVGRGDTVFEDEPAWETVLEKERNAEQVWVVSDNLYLDLQHGGKFQESIEDRWKIWISSNIAWIDELKKRGAALADPTKPPYRYIIPRNALYDSENGDKADEEQSHAGKPLAQAYVDTYLALLPEKAKKRMVDILFLQIDDGFFGVFGPHPERTFHYLESGGGSELLVFTKPDSKQNKHFTDDLYAEIYAADKKDGQAEICEYYRAAFDGFWRRRKDPQTQLNETGGICFGDIELVRNYERSAAQIRVLSPDMAVDRNVEWIRDITRTRLNDDNNFGRWYVVSEEAEKPFRELLQDNQGYADIATDLDDLARFSADVVVEGGAILCETRLYSMTVDNFKTSVLAVFLKRNEKESQMSVYLEQDEDKAQRFAALFDALWEGRSL